MSQATTALGEVRTCLHLRVDLFQLGGEEASNGTLKSLPLKSGIMLFGTQADLIWKAYYIAYHCVTLGKSLNMYAPQFSYLINESKDLHLIGLSLV